ncbi:MAG: Mu-like prophage major head subunit gpT family protein [Acidobacteriota bacterium]|nr:Mu-like prophage major head subunit gpT family protein [Acidobacteriota bacterium]
MTLYIGNGDLQDLQSEEIEGMYYEQRDALEEASWVGDVAMDFDSDKGEEQYDFLGHSPTVKKKRRGPSTGEELDKRGIRIANEEYEATLRVKSKDMRRDKTGQIQARVSDFARGGVEFRERNTAQTLAAGESTVCYDGSYFFDTTHQWGKSGQQTNIKPTAAANPAAITNTEVADGLLFAVEDLLLQRNNQGDFCNGSARNFLVLTGVRLVRKHTELTKEKWENEGNNPMYGSNFNFRFAFSPWINWSNKAIILATDYALKPAIIQTEVPLELHHLGENSDHHFFNKELIWRLEGELGFGLGEWLRAMLVVWQ